MNTTVFFIDTSALFKRYVNEIGTDMIDSLFKEAGACIISNLTIIEFLSNLKRLVDVYNVIDNNTYNAVKSEFFKDIADGKIKVEPVSSLNIITSVELINKKYITPINSIQLATALNLKENYTDVSFVCSDGKLCDIAEDRGIKVIRINC